MGMYGLIYALYHPEGSIQNTAKKDRGKKSLLEYTGVFISLPGMHNSPSPPIVT